LKTNFALIRATDGTAEIYCQVEQGGSGFVAGKGQRTETLSKMIKFFTAADNCARLIGLITCLTKRRVKPMAEPLAEERKFFSEHQSEWKDAHAGKFVLVKGKELVGTFNRAEDAIAEGARRFGKEPFLVRSVDQEKDIYIPALALGILNARSSQPV